MYLIIIFNKYTYEKPDLHSWRERVSPPKKNDFKLKFQEIFRPCTHNQTVHIVGGCVMAKIGLKRHQNLKIKKHFL